MSLEEKLEATRAASASRVPADKRAIILICERLES
jgi:hypothetical protein